MRRSLHVRSTIFNTFFFSSSALFIASSFSTAPVKEWNYIFNALSFLKNRNKKLLSVGAVSNSTEKWGNDVPSKILLVPMGQADVKIATDMAPAGYEVVVACAVGYRSADDKYAGMKKIRFPKARVIARV